MTASRTFTLRIATSLLAIVALLATAAMLALIQLEAATEARDERTRAAVADLLYAERLRAAAERTTAASRGYLLTRSPDSLTRATESAAELDALLARFPQRRNPRLAEAVTTAAGEYENALATLLQSRGGAAEGTAMIADFERSVIPLRRKLLVALDAFVAAEQADVDASYTRSKAAADLAQKRSLMLMGGAVALSVALGVMVSRGLARAYARERAALERAERAIEARQDLLAMVAHDLRNPLGVISLRAHELQQATDHPGCIHNAERIAHTARRAGHLIDTLVDAASIDAGHFAVAPTRVRLSELLHEAANEVDELARQRLLHLHINARRDALIRADAPRIIQVLVNLLGNAIKFTPEGGVVSLRAELNGANVRFAVTDTGPGVPPSERARLFQRFWTTRKGGKAGTGLGLYISRGIVRAHGGDIDVHNEAGKGATFSFTLPGPIDYLDAPQQEQNVH